MAARTRKPAKPKPEAEAPEEEPKAPEQPDAVLIVKTVDEAGNIGTDVAPLGTVAPTEVATLIELGLGSWRRKIGLNG